MKAITIHQPWAWAIAAGHKPVENRGWATSYRGPLAIHAGGVFDRAAMEDDQMWKALAGGQPPPIIVETASFSRGAVIAVVQLVAVCTGRVPGRVSGMVRGMCECGPWARDGQYHWQLADPRPLRTPVGCRGFQGLWTLHSLLDAALEDAPRAVGPP